MKLYKIIVSIMLLFCVLSTGCSSTGGDAERLYKKYYIPFCDIIAESAQVTLEASDLLKRGIINEREYRKRTRVALEKEIYQIREVMDGVYKEDVSNNVKPLQEQMVKVMRMCYDSGSKLLEKHKKGDHFGVVSDEEIAFGVQCVRESDKVVKLYEKLTGKEKPY